MTAARLKVRDGIGLYAGCACDAGDIEWHSLFF